MKCNTTEFCTSGLHAVYPPGSPYCHHASLRIASQDLQDLCGMSGLTGEVLCASGIRSLTGEDAGIFTGYRKAGAGFVIPYPELADDLRTSASWPPVYWRYRRRNPQRIHKSDEKPVKYLAPRGVSPRLYVPPLAPFTVGDWPDETWIVEGEKKALAASAAGLPTVGVAGIWSWKTAGVDDLVTVLPEFRRIANGRDFVLVYDSDITERHPGYPAFHRLGRVLLQLGASSARVLSMPSSSALQELRAA